jgi:CRISPR-associated protein Cas2
MYLMISYDIGSNKRRQKMHDLLRCYGKWIQYSVFECRLTEPQFKALRQRMKTLINEDDNIRIYRLCGDCQGRIEQLGVEVQEAQNAVMTVW